MGPFSFTFEKWELDGQEVGHDFVRMHTKDWVQCITFDKHGNLVLVSQFRHGESDLSLEFPCGTREPGEDTAITAVRELREETGYTSEDEPIFIGSCNPNPAFMANKMFVYLLLNAEKTHDTDMDPGEATEVVVQKYLLNVLSGTTLATVALYNAWARDNERPSIEVH